MHTLASTDQKVQSDIDHFLRATFTERYPSHMVLGVLRYGAHLPHLRTCLPDSENIDVKLVLSHMLEFLPDTAFENRSVVVLDDTVYRGRQMQRHVSRLQQLGIPRSQIKTAAVIVHEASEYEPDYFLHKLSDREYVAWKEALSRLVRTQRRSTDRDHPLYFFSLDGVSSSAVLSLLERFGYLSTVPNANYGDVYAFSVTVDSEVLTTESRVLGEWPRPVGLKTEPVSKIRLYWSETNGTLSLTAVPISFCTITLESLLADKGGAFENLVGIRLDDLSYLRPRQDAWGKFVFYLCSRAVAGRLLVRFLEDFCPAIAALGGRIRFLDAAEQDYPVQYQLPEPYLRFYGHMSKAVHKCLESSCGLRDQAQLDFGWPRAHITEWGLMPFHLAGATMPAKYSLLDILTRERDCVEYDGKDWVAVETPGQPFSAFMELVNDPLTVSRALDEMLDCGLLRAEDGLIAGAEARYSRLFAAGGEYNARTVSRLARAYRQQMANASCGTDGPDGTDYFADQECFSTWGAEG